MSPLPLRLRFFWTKSFTISLAFVAPLLTLCLAPAFILCLKYLSPVTLPERWRKMKWMMKDDERWNIFLLLLYLTSFKMKSSITSLVMFSLSLPTTISLPDPSLLFSLQEPLHALYFSFMCLSPWRWQQCLPCCCSFCAQQHFFLLLEDVWKILLNEWLVLCFNCLVVAQWIWCSQDLELLELLHSFWGGGMGNIIPTANTLLDLKNKYFFSISTWLFSKSKFLVALIVKIFVLEIIKSSSECFFLFYFITWLPFGSLRISWF